MTPAAWRDGVYMDQIIKNLISEFVKDLKKSNDIALEHNNTEHYYGTIANWQFNYLINKWIGELELQTK